MKNNLLILKFSQFFIRAALTALWPIAQLPLKFQIQMGRCIGLVIFCSAKRLRMIARININKCFPQLTETERNALLKQNFISLGIGFMETLMARLTSEHRLQDLLHVQGIEHLDNAKAQNKGILFLGSHFTTIPIMSRLSTQITPIAVMHRNANNPILDEFTKNNYAHNHVKAIGRHDLRGMVNCLKQKIPVWYSPDVDAGPKRSVFVPFFGIDTATITTVSRFAKLANAVVIPIAFYRRDDGKGYDMHIYPTLENFPGDDLRQDAARINQIIENIILKNPAQYLWQYKRFKTRPPGERRFYPDKKGEFKIQQ